MKQLIDSRKNSSVQTRRSSDSNYFGRMLDCLDRVDTPLSDGLGQHAESLIGDKRRAQAEER